VGSHQGRFWEAFKLPAAERAAYLDLPARATRSCALKSNGCSPRVATTITESGLEFLARELSPGDTVAHYKIQAKLGEGGMGAVASFG